MEISFTEKMDITNFSFKNFCHENFDKLRGFPEGKASLFEGVYVKRRKRKHSLIEDESIKN